MISTIRHGGGVLLRARRRLLTTLALAPALMVSACGGGGGSGSEPPEEPPAFTTGPTDVAAVEGQTTSFSVAVTGGPAPTIQWQVKLAGSDSTWANVGTNSPSYTFVADAEHDGASYRAVATNSAGTATSAPATLAVSEAQRITHQPQDQARRPGESEVLFMVTAAGEGLRYQWQSSTDGGITFADIDGATNASYIHKGAADDATDALRVRVSKLGFDVDSRTAKLTRLAWRPTTLQPTGGQNLNDVVWLDDTTAVAVGDASAIIHSTDAGATWQIVAERAAPESGFRRIAFNADGVGIVVGGHTPMRSTDRGLHWAAIDPAIGPGKARAVAFGDSTQVVAVVEGGDIAYSRDAGLNWSRATFDGAVAPDSLLDVTMNAAGVGLAVGRDGQLLRSTDGGQRWRRVPAPNGLSTTFQRVTFASSTVAFAAGEFGHRLRSNDAGATWGQLMPFDFDEQGFQDLKFSSPSEGVAVTAIGETFLTNSGGHFWIEVASGANAVAISPDHSILAVGRFGLVQRSVDSGWSWQDLAPTASLGWDVDMAFASPSVGIAAGPAGSIYRTTTGGLDWTPVITNGRLMANAAAFADSTTAVAVGSRWDGHPSISRSTDAGQTWSEVAGATTFNLADVAFATSRIGMAVGNAGLHRTTDSGATWTEVGSTDATAVAFGSASVGIVLGWDNEALRTTDGGAHWTPIPSPIGVAHHGHLAFADAQVVVAVSRDSTKGSIFRSADGGLTWSVVRSLTGDASEPRFVRVRFASPLVGVAVGTRGALARTTDGGLTWTDEFLPDGNWLSDIEFISPTTVLTVNGAGAILRNDRF